MESLFPTVMLVQSQPLQTGDQVSRVKTYPVDKQLQTRLLGLQLDGRVSLSSAACLHGPELTYTLRNVRNHPGGTFRQNNPQAGSFTWELQVQAASPDCVLEKVGA